MGVLRDDQERGEVVRHLFDAGIFVRLWAACSVGSCGAKRREGYDMCEWAKETDKPSSVSRYAFAHWGGDHLSRPAVADGLKRPTRGQAGP